MPLSEASHLASAAARTPKGCLALSCSLCSILLQQRVWSSQHRAALGRTAPQQRLGLAERARKAAVQPPGDNGLVCEMLLRLEMQELQQLVNLAPAKCAIEVGPSVECIDKTSECQHHTDFTAKWQHRVVALMAGQGRNVLPCSACYMRNEGLR